MPGILSKALTHPDATAILEPGASHTYGYLYQASLSLAGRLLDGRSDLSCARVAFLIPPGFGYVRTQWAIWLAGGIAVPVSLSHPLPAIVQLLEDTAAHTIVTARVFLPLLQETAERMDIRLLTEEDEVGMDGDITLPEVEDDRAALILYTSGTTSRPKGVVLTHANLGAQMDMLIDAWGWTSEDHILCVLPLHHVHGIVNVVGCALRAGARLEFLPSFTPAGVIDAFLRGSVNLFMAVPTIYHKLISHLDALPEGERQALRHCMSRFRLMVCGSAALPVTVMDRWEKLSSQRLLERYGMTEIGMALSNPLHGERRAGTVGMPLPGVQIRLVDEQLTDVAAGEPGEILVKGPNVFREYWCRPDATAGAFTEGGWFRTGDLAVVEEGYYRILGRLSTDIIKTGGYKVSALEIEEVMRMHPGVRDCAVASLPDEEWGELIVAAVVADEALDTDALDGWLRERLPRYKLPRRYLAVRELPRNAMGKVVKADVRALF
ncbi:MAG: long-chain fatty acid--CoA ligase [Chitinophagia bacterium]|nr:long-chain fatty acid--CoA ligase [Chitinophagia bacterium]